MKMKKFIIVVSYILGVYAMDVDTTKDTSYSREEGTTSNVNAAITNPREEMPLEEEEATSSSDETHSVDSGELHQPLKNLHVAQQKTALNDILDKIKVQLEKYPEFQNLQTIEPVVDWESTDWKTQSYKKDAWNFLRSLLEDFDCIKQQSFESLDVAQAAGRIFSLFTDENRMQKYVPEFQLSIFKNDLWDLIEVLEFLQEKIPQIKEVNWYIPKWYKNLYFPNGKPY